MKKITKSVLSALAGITILFATTAFIVNDPQADFTKQNVCLEDQITLSEIKTKNLEKGTFKSSLKFKQNNFDSPAKEFYGQEITITDNPKVDRILIGVTNNLISRIEIWNQNILVETKELGFMDKMTWGETQTMSIDFYDHTNQKNKGKSKISMRFYGGIGFFGDIGTINLDLTEYGDLSGNKSIGVFAKSINSNSLNKPEFSDLKIWKNYKSFD
ncbi:MAG: hypothetical protein RBR97_20925 [Bacteroidales bacterium]|jgi:hypothetical protein|nr:hypothetical protein [Bacteroidales bacterium]